MTIGVMTVDECIVTPVLCRDTLHESTEGTLVLIVVPAVLFVEL